MCKEGCGCVQERDEMCTGEGYVHKRYVQERDEMCAGEGYVHKRDVGMYTGEE